MKISRKEFLKYCAASAAVMGLSVTELSKLQKLIAKPGGPKVIWLQGSGCTGCSMSLINHVSDSVPYDIQDLLINHIDLKYHPNLTSEDGEDVYTLLQQEHDEGGYVLVIEGGVPTKYDGATCLALTTADDVDITFLELVQYMAEKAAHVMAVGSCASYGGIPASGPNVTDIKPLKEILPGKKVISITGCPPHPNTIVWPIVQIILGKTIQLDAYGRPRELYKETVHMNCERRGRVYATGLAQQGACLYQLGCKGPKTWGSCPTTKWNNGMSWCIESNSPCIGCNEATFPGNKPLYRIPKA
jgi:hydrogenase small subunit